MIKLEAMRVFVTVAELGNIKDASDRLGRTASAISMTLKQIEEEVGGPLFESDRKNALTALGAFMLDTGREQIDAYDRAIRRVHAYAQSRIGQLTVASVPSVAANLVPPLLHRFIDDHPGVEIELIDTDSRSVRLQVEQGNADLGIAGRPRSDALVSFQPLFGDSFMLVCSSESPLCRLGRPVEWRDLQSEVFILNGAVTIGDVPGYRGLADKALITVRNVTSLLAMARESLGVTLLPKLTTIHLPDGVAALELADVRMKREVGLIERRNVRRSPVAAAFRQSVLDEAAAWIEGLDLDPVAPAERQ